MLADIAAQDVLDGSEAVTPPRTLIDIFRDTVARYPEASALDDGAGALSYGELSALVWRTAARLWKPTCPVAMSPVFFRLAHGV